MSVNKRYQRWFAGAVIALAGTVPLGIHAAVAQPANYYPGYTPDTARITKAVDTSQMILVKGSQPALAVAKYDTGALPAIQQIHNVTLLLKRSDTKQKQFDGYLAQLTNPSSPYFHHWLTAEQIGTMFGPAQTDLAKVKQWLQSQGLKIDTVSPTGMMVHFSGTAAAMGQAFHTTLHSYTVNGEKHFANATAQQIPAALASVVQGAAALHNFFPKPQYHNVGLVSKDKKTGAWKTIAKVASTPQFTVPPGTIETSTTHDVVPADFDTIYNVNPLWGQATPIRGAGQIVAVLERTDVLPADIQTFRNAFMPGNAQGMVSYVNPVQYAGDTSCPDPGTNGDESEAALDAEWIGAADPDANIVFASCDDSQSATFGPFQAAENLLYGATPRPTIMSLSYGECEPDGFVDGIATYVGGLWSTAAAEGVTVFVASGDAGSVGCDQNAHAAYQGLAVNSMASTPYNVAVGGTDFNDFKNVGAYWSSANLPLGESALGYIPEQTWNDSCASSQLYPLLGYSNGIDACNSASGQSYLDTQGGGGGPSTNWYQPAWQVGIYGSMNYTMRTLPDVSLFAANGLYGHALVYCMSDPNIGGTPCDYSNPDNVFYNSAGGTSFAAPAMAGVQALINQVTGQAQGNVLPEFYNIATKEYGTNGSPNTAMLNACNSSSGAQSGSNCVFNDITVGDIDEPCFAGTQDCYSGAGLEHYGMVVSTNGAGDMVPAWMTNAGYSYATGLGSINATNLVNAVAKFEQPFKRGYVAPYDFVSSEDLGGGFSEVGDGFSDIALVDPVKGTLTALGMRGGVVMKSNTQSITPGYTINTVSNVLPPINHGYYGSYYSDQLFWTGPDHHLYVWMTEPGSSIYYPLASGYAYPVGWNLVGAAVTDGSRTSQLLWFNSTTAQYGWWSIGYNDTTGEFTANIGPVINVTRGYVPTLADVNGDGYADIVWTSTTNNSVYVWINNQQGGFVAHRIPDHPAGFTLFGAGDVDGDGMTDLIWTSPSTSQMAWWVMDGYQVSDQEVRSVAPGYAMASIADYDGDGLADILWVGTAGDAYEWQSTGTGFESFRVADATGKPLVIPAGTQVQANRLQGSATGNINTSTGSSH